jgi:diketogulonate reductase-like aldo/keto reductase
VPLEETMLALERLVAEGKARSIGVSNFDTWDLREAARMLKSERIACNQILYNLDERTIEDHELPWARAYGCAVVAYTPLGQRALRARSKRFAVLNEIATRHGVSPQAIALNFLTRDPLVFAIPKASRQEHVLANAKAADIALDEEEVRAIDAAFPKRPRVGPLPTN